MIYVEQDMIKKSTIGKKEEDKINLTSSTFLV